MTKTTKAVLSVAILGAGGYLLWKNFKKPSTATSFAGDSSAAARTVVGKRVQMSGKATDRLANKSMYANTLGGNIVDVQATSWVRGAANIRQGGNGAPAGFFDTQSSGWVRR